MEAARVTYCTTYDKVTPESAEVGDFAEHGFIGPMGMEYAIPDGLVGDEFKAWIEQWGPFDHEIEPTDADDVPGWALDACPSAVVQTGGRDDAIATVDLSVAFACFDVLSDLGGVEDNGDGTFYEVDPSQDRDYFEKGEETRRAVHFEGLSVAQGKLLSALVAYKG
jgi:hypothetical protein